MVSRRTEPHAEWTTWPAPALRALRTTLKAHGALAFHEAALKRWAEQVLYITMLLPHSPHDNAPLPEHSSSSFLVIMSFSFYILC